MIRNYKYRIYPNATQAKALEDTFNFCRFLYNCALEERITYHKKYKKFLNYHKQCLSLRRIKEVFPEVKNKIHSHVLQQTLKQLDGSYQHFFRRIKKGETAGFPRFKGKDRFKSICYLQPIHDLSGGCVKKLANGKLRISKLPGELKVKWHRPFEGRCKQVRIIKQADKWFICLSCDDVPMTPLGSTGKSVAIDFGITNFITQDDGVVHHHPRAYKTAKEKLANHNRKLAAKQRGSMNHKRALVALQRAHQKVHNIRTDFQHKLSKQLVEENDVIIIEKLNIKSMLENNGFAVGNSNITDASWGSFADMLSYKAENAGRKLIEVDPRNTSKTCSGCGNVKKNLTLQDRLYHCDACGIEIDRDRNAAINIKKLGMSFEMTNCHSEIR